MNKKNLSIRIDEQTLRKLRVVAELENRSANGQILFLIRRCIEEHERENETAL